MWIPAAGVLLQCTALGGSHGQRNDDDLDVLLVTTLNRTAEEHCSNNAIGGHFFQRVASINEATLRNLSVPEARRAFVNRCVCEYNGFKLLCQNDSYEKLDRYIGPSWWFPILGGGKVMSEYQLPLWGIPTTSVRLNPWFMARGKENLEALKLYDEDGDMHISLHEFMNRLHVASSNNEFNMKWFATEVEKNPCRVINSWIHLNHSLW